MILEELIGGFVSLLSSLVIHAPPVTRENIQRDQTLIFEENPEEDEANYHGLIHREYEQAQFTDLPYYEEDIFVWGQDDAQHGRNFCESLFRSFKANVGVILAVLFILGPAIAVVVYVNLNTKSACYEWKQNHLKVPSHVQVLQLVGMSVSLLPLILWFPASIALLWGFKEFRKNYLWYLCVIDLVTESLGCVYNIIVFDKLVLNESTVWLWVLFWADISFYLNLIIL